VERAPCPPNTPGHHSLVNITSPSTCGPGDLAYCPWALSKCICQHLSFLHVPSTRLRCRLVASDRPTAQSSPYPEHRLCSEVDLFTQRPGCQPPYAASLSNIKTFSLPLSLSAWVPLPLSNPPHRAGFTGFFAAAPKFIFKGPGCTPTIPQLISTLLNSPPTGLSSVMNTARLTNPRHPGSEKSRAWHPSSMFAMNVAQLAVVDAS
jgi:hypothetical protein